MMGVYDVTWKPKHIQFSSFVHYGKGSEYETGKRLDNDPASFNLTATDAFL